VARAAAAKCWTNLAALRAYRSVPFLEVTMFKTIALVGLVAAVTVPQAYAESGYGTEGPYGRRLHHQAQSTFQRGWNAHNQSKYRAEESARWVRQHHGYPSPF
jgi:hypothetical protein